jgi:hypothetical protein
MQDCARSETQRLGPVLEGGQEVAAKRDLRREPAVVFGGSAISAHAA